LTVSYATLPTTRMDMGRRPIGCTCR
jgi:hypothetical protein